MAELDSLYLLLFRNPLMVEHLVRAFLPAPLTAGIDFAGMHLVPAKFAVRARGQKLQRKGDLVWCLPTYQGANIYFYLHFEFQSTVDWWMALRVQVYQGLLLQQIVVERELKRHDVLPPILTIVLYNGMEEWRAPTMLSGLIGLPEASLLWPWQPQACYYVLDMRACSEEQLQEKSNLAVLLFRLEQKQSEEKYLGLLDDVVAWFRRHPDYEELKGLFTELVCQGMKNMGIKEELPKDLQEIRIMFPGLAWREEVRQQGLKEGLEKGLEEGLEKGLEEGLKKGKALALFCVLRGRFGVLPSYVDVLVGEAGSAQLDVWLETAIKAPSLEALFGNQLH